MYMYMYIHTCTCIYIHVVVRIHVYTYIYIYTCTCAYVYIHVHVQCTFIDTGGWVAFPHASATCSLLHTCNSMYMHVHVHVYIQCTCTCTCMWVNYLWLRRVERQPSHPCLYMYCMWVNYFGRSTHVTVLSVYSYGIIELVCTLTTKKIWGLFRRLSMCI